MHGFDIHQREILTQSVPPQQPPTNATPDNVHFSRDNNGPFVKIYYADNNKEYDFFERNPQPAAENLVFMKNSNDVFNNYLPNTQNQMPFTQLQLNANASTSAATPAAANISNQSVIHHLVASNLGPGKFGTFGGVGNLPTGVTNNSFNPIATAPPQSSTISSASPPTLNISIPTILDHIKHSPSKIDNHNLPTQHHLHNDNVNNNNNNINIINAPLQTPLTSRPTPNGNSSIPPSTSIIGANSKKPRMVAEVKPMRMSYSDVVSKNKSEGFAQNTSSPSAVHSANSASSSPNTTMPVASSKISKAASKYTTPNFEKKSQDVHRKSPTNPIITNNNGINNNAMDAKQAKSQHSILNVKPDKPSSSSTTTNSSASQVQAAAAGLKKKKSNANSNHSKSLNRNDSYKVKSNKYTTDSDDEDDDDEDDNDDECDSESYGDSENYYDDNTSAEFYDKNSYQNEHHKIERIKTSTFKKNRQQNLSTSATASKKGEKGSKRVTGRSTNRKQKHEFLQKIFASCIEYLYIFVKWLWFLVYDVSYLSYGIVYDRLSWVFQCVMQGVHYARNELSGNPGKAFIAWNKNAWKKFDNRFDKKSKWAFWRWIFKKQSSNENGKENYKEGRLPKTAEEAMKSLLNCKEKDAYR
jgi:DnaJ family protein C protein 14